MTRLFTFLFSMFMAAAALAQSSPNNVLAQLGVNGVTDKIYGTNAALYANYLIKTGTNGLIDISLMPATVAPHRWNKTVFIDSVNGLDSTNAGTATCPYKTFSYAVGQTTNDVAFVFTPGTYVGATIANSNIHHVALVGLDPTNTTMSGTLSFNAVLPSGTQDISVDLYDISVNGVQQWQYGLFNVGVYNRAKVPVAINRLYQTTNSYLTVFVDPSAYVGSVLGSSNMAVSVKAYVPQGTAAGQLTYWDGFNWQLVTPGTTNQLLTGGTAPAWNTIVFMPPGTTNGDMLYWNGTNWLPLAAGTTNQTLYGGPVPSWHVPTIVYTNLPGDFLPAFSNIYSIGSQAVPWSNGWFGTALYVNGTNVMGWMSLQGGDVFKGSNNTYAAGTVQTMPTAVVSNLYVPTYLELFGIGITNFDTNVVLYADGSQAMTGSLLPATSNTVDLGSQTMPFRQVNASNFNVVGSSVSFNGDVALTKSGTAVVVHGGLQDTNGVIFASRAGNTFTGLQEARRCRSAIGSSVDGVGFRHVDTNDSAGVETWVYVGAEQWIYGKQEDLPLIVGAGGGLGGFSVWTNGDNVAVMISTNYLDLYTYPSVYPLQVIGNFGLIGTFCGSLGCIAPSNVAGGAIKEVLMGNGLGVAPTWQGNAQNWDDAYGWGNHATAGYMNAANHTNIVQKFTLTVQDPTNGIVYWMANPYDTRSSTLTRAYVKVHGMTGTVDIVSQNESDLWYTYSSITNGVAATATGTAQTSFTGPTAITNGMRIGIVPGALSAFAATNMLSVDFTISCP